MGFSSERFWLQLHNLPMACMNRKLREQIGQSIGSVIQVDTFHEGLDWGWFLRVLVDVDIQMPMARGRTIKWKGESTWIPIHYEKLPKICFSCGCMVHGAAGCDAGSHNGVLDSSS